MVDTATEHNRAAVGDLDRRRRSQRTSSTTLVLGLVGMSKALLDQVAKQRKEIKTEVITYGLSELVNMQRTGDIRIRPEYQRLFRWTREQQSLFIESLILEIPVPPLFFYENEDGKWELLDGLQRLSTIIKFMGTEADVPDTECVFRPWRTPKPDDGEHRNRCMAIGAERRWLVLLDRSILLPAGRPL